MKVYKEETQTGELETITFRPDLGESTDAFRTAVKNWVRSNYSSMTWESFINRLINWEADRITLSMK